MKRITTALMVAGVSVTLLAGCGSKDKETAATTVPVATAESGTVEEVAVVENSSGSDTEVVAVVEESTTAMSAMSETAAAAPADGAYVSPDGAYSVAFPTEPTIAQGAAVAIGPNGTVYNVTAMPAPNDNLDEAVKAMQAQLGSAPTNVTDVDVDGRKAKRFDFTMKTGGVEAPGVALVVIDGDSAYLVMAAAATGDTADAGKFVDSFQLLK